MKILSSKFVIGAFSCALGIIAGRSFGTPATTAPSAGTGAITLGQLAASCETLVDGQKSGMVRNVYVSTQNEKEVYVTEPLGFLVKTSFVLNHVNHSMSVSYDGVLMTKTDLTIFLGNVREGEKAKGTLLQAGKSLPVECEMNL